MISPIPSGLGFCKDNYFWVKTRGFFDSKHQPKPRRKA